MDNNTQVKMLTFCKSQNKEAVMNPMMSIPCVTLKSTGKCELNPFVTSENNI